ncbi:MULTISPECIES: MFS transporter [Bacillaceae]|jgi:MFS transporter, DHA3 family, macrolide efflux protein|uniref:Major facilitator superfamily transporter MFS_1 n=1 Tax=Caldibacillus thermoamylovorans TaxID=35841 RepID=A0A090IUI1_9BACI|nr:MULTISPECIES: MFS transporter [Bacillaceae]MBU5342750.1 MFS transporter [Caldifermentibacillus hisashii]MCM3477982.1 MFS transporter [Caldibacillus thermoamylovorans]MED4850443.1 MFS transporter [Caldifermentibacillus hisashii]CEE00093.1 major facilitator superfamily transporter MFS_1 [Caldibacillus thermoamylovorans]
MNSATHNDKSNWYKNIVLFLSSQAISLFGSSLVQYAMMWYITLSTESGVMMTIYIICGFIPTFILSPVAGVWADRYNRKMLIVLSDGLIALATLILAILFLMGFDDIWLLFLMAAIRAFGTGIQTPAVGAILPQIVPKNKLTKVNGINGSIQAIIMFVSPLVSAALLGMATMEIIFFIDVVTAAIAIGTLLIFLKIPLHEKAKDKQTTSYLSDFKLGLQYVNSHDFLKKFFLFFALFMVLMAPASFLTPLQVARSFGDDVWRLTAIEIVFSIGMMAGGAIIASWGGFSNKVKTMGFATVIMGVCTFALGSVPNFWIYLFFMGVFGVAMPILNTPATVLLQEKIEEDYLGRVFGVMGMISTSMMPIGMLIFGPLADMVKIEWLLIGTGAFIMCLSLLLVKNHVLIEAGKSSG